MLTTDIWLSHFRSDSFLQKRSKQALPSSRIRFCLNRKEGGRVSRWIMIPLGSCQAGCFTFLGGEVVAIELPSKVNHSNYAAFYKLMCSSATQRYFRILSKKKTASVTRPWRDVTREPISAWTAVGLHGGWATPFFVGVFFNCHSGLLTVPRRESHHSQRDKQGF